MVEDYASEGNTVPSQLPSALRGKWSRNPEPASPGPPQVEAAGTSPPQNQSDSQGVGPSVAGQRVPRSHTKCPPPIPPEGLSALAAFRLLGAIPNALFIFLSRGVVNTGPAPGEMGKYRVKDDKSQPSSQAGSADIHLHLIHQGRSHQLRGLSHLRGHGGGPQEPLWL